MSSTSFKKSTPKSSTPTANKSPIPTPNKSPTVLANRQSALSEPLQPTNVLISSLSQYRQNLTRKLQTLTLMYSTCTPIKCLNHDSYITLYDSKENKPICAMCFNEGNKKRQVESPRNTPRSRKTNPKPALPPTTLPIEKADCSLEDNLKTMGAQLQKELLSLNSIQKTLYEGFNNEIREYQFKAIEINQLESSINKAVSEYFEACRILLDTVLRQEKKRHEEVIKEICLLRDIVQEYSQNSLDLSYQDKFQILNNPVSLGDPLRRRCKDYSPSFDIQLHNSYYTENEKRNRQLQQSRAILEAISNSLTNPQPQKQVQSTLVKYMIQSELISNLKFSQARFSWDLQHHSSSIKNTADGQILKIKSVYEYLKQIKIREPFNYRYNRTIRAPDWHWSHGHLQEGPTSDTDSHSLSPDGPHQPRKANRPRKESRSRSRQGTGHK